MTPDLLQRIRLGDESAFEELFRNLHPALCEVVNSYVRSDAVAEEIVQDLFFAVWTKRGTLAADSLQGYLFRAARNRALHHTRHESIVRRAALLRPFRPEVSGIAHAPAATDANLYADERRQLLFNAIEQLPPRSRLAAVLKIDHAMTDREIAEAMDVSVKGVEKLLSIAKRHLSTLLRDRDLMLPFDKY